MQPDGDLPVPMLAANIPAGFDDVGSAFAGAHLSWGEVGAL